MTFKRSIPYLFFMVSLLACESSPNLDASSEEEASVQNESSTVEIKMRQDEEMEEVDIKDIDGNRELYSRRKSDLAKSGDYVKYNADGQLVEKSFYLNDTLHLYRVFYYETGDTQIVETLDRGRYDGPFKSFYANGQLELLGVYQDNVATGQWKKYYDSGDLMEVVTFADNKENGPFIEYFRNGKVKAEGSYKNGPKEHGLLSMYDENGALIRKMDCKNGICKTIWKVGDQAEPDAIQSEKQIDSKKKEPGK